MSWITRATSELLVARLRHAGLVDGQRDDGGAVLDDDRHVLLDPAAAVLHVDGVDDRAAGIRLERRASARRSRCVSNTSGASMPIASFLVDDRHLLGLVAALGQRHADVERVGAVLDLVARDPEHAVVVVGEQRTP